MRVRFGEFVLDSDRRELSRAGRQVHLSPKAFDLLCALVAERPRVVRKERLYEQLWPDTFVQPANLNNLVSEIRKAIGDRDRGALQTKPRFGWAFAAETVLEPETHSVPGDRRFHLLYAGRSHTLHPGRTLIGRDPDCTIVIDSPAVSRFHAAIDVSGSIAVVEDLGSKNGTFVGARRIDAPVTLNDRDELEIGRALLRFRIIDRKESTVSDPRTT